MIAGSQTLMGLMAAPYAFAATKKPAHAAPPLFGKVDAKKRFSIWGSYTCPFTALLVVAVLQKIVADMSEQVSLEWHHFPTHSPDPALHVAGLAFTGEHFWNFTTAMLKFIYNANGDFSGLTPDKILELAKAEGGSQALLNKAYADQTKWKTVKDDFLAGQLLGITKTPGLFYDGYFLTPGGMPADLKAFDTSLRAMVQKA